MGTRRHPLPGAVLIPVRQPVLRRIREDWSQVRSIPRKKEIASVLIQATRVASLPCGEFKAKCVSSSRFGDSERRKSKASRHGRALFLDLSKLT